MLDLLTGWVIVACGLLAWARVPRSRVGCLLVLVGLTWFIGNLGDRNSDAGRVAEALTFLYAGVLAHGLFTYPTGRISRAFDRGLVAGGYLIALALPIWQRDAGLVIIAMLLCVGLLAQRATETTAARRAHRPALWIGLLLAASLAAKGLVQPMLRAMGAPESLDIVTLLREAALVVSAAALTWSLLDHERRRMAMTDLVVEMGGPHVPGLAAELRLTLGDDSLEVGFRRDGSDVFVDEDGRALRLPTSPGKRTFQVIEHDGAAVAVLVHDGGFANDPPLRDALGRAAAIGARNRSLRTELSEQVAQLEASRRRLLEAGDAERQALEGRLRLGAARRLAALDATMTSIGSAFSQLSPAAVAHIERAATQLRRARIELDELARGLDPGLLTERGLVGALRELADRSPVPVACALDAGASATASVATTLYFVASEALTNVARHAGAAHAWLRLVEEQERISLLVDDDGVGGADPRRGGGLRGLRDRLDALGGTLTVAARAEGGTRLTASVPSSAAGRQAPAPTAA